MVANGLTDLRLTELQTHKKFKVNNTKTKKNSLCEIFLRFSLETFSPGVNRGTPEVVEFWNVGARVGEESAFRNYPLCFGAKMVERHVMGFLF